MNKKIFITLLLISLFISTCTYSLAANNSMMDNARNTVMNAGNTVGNAVTGATNAVVNGAKNLTNGAMNVGNDITNANGDTENDATNTLATGGMFDNNDSNYTATRTATGNGNFLGMSDNTWTWLILGIVGVAIVGLVWYYGAQYEHKNYNND